MKTAVFSLALVLHEGDVTGFVECGVTSNEP